MCKGWQSGRLLAWVVYSLIRPASLLLMRLAQDRTVMAGLYGRTCRFKYAGPAHVAVLCFAGTSPDKFPAFLHRAQGAAHDLQECGWTCLRRHRRSD